jgi:hypothetical protein
MWRPGLSPCAWRSTRRTPYPASRSTRARPTSAVRLARTPCRSTTAPQRHAPGASHAASSLPDRLAIRTASAPSPSGGGPISTRAGATTSAPTTT